MQRLVLRGYEHRLDHYQKGSEVASCTWGSAQTSPGVDEHTQRIDGSWGRLRDTIQSYRTDVRIALILTTLEGKGQG